MEEKAIGQLLTQILYSVLNEDEKNGDLNEKLSDDVLSSVYLFAKKHDLAHILAHFVYQNRIDAKPKLLKKLQHEELMSVYRYEQMRYAFDEISSAFDAANIAYIPLKGAILRPYYPFESMRTSCDIDILIHEADLPRAVRALQNKGYQSGAQQYHDVSLYSPTKIHLELHFTIQENMENLDTILKNAWQYAVLSRGNRHDFQDEFFVFYMYAHMAYHFLCGGCGIRSLMDIWVMEHKMNLSYTRAKGLLEKAEIYQFAKEMSNVANSCFTQNGHDEFTELILGYIYKGGIYGNAENNMAVHKVRSNSKFIYVMQRLFLPYNAMTILFPVLKRVPFLLPFCWIVRWGRALLGGEKKRLASEVSHLNTVQNDKVAQVKVICERLGLL
ncbi:MAG: nucleotidyltransferase family protein [Clostridia bacterium]|nr:nucleotidyltransferase family protein [Clostridia bacterium]